MFIRYSKARCVDESLSVMFAGRTADADAKHQRRQRWHIYVVYVSPHGPCAWIGASAMLRASNNYPLRFGSRHGFMH